MVIISRQEWGGTEEELELEVAEFHRALDEHRASVGQPAPRHAHPWVEHLARSGADWLLEAPPRRAWAIRKRGPGEKVLARETREDGALFDGEELVYDDPSDKVLDPDGVTVRAERQQERLARRRAERWEEFKAMRTRLLNATLTCDWNGSTWQAREEDQKRLDSAVAKLEDPKLPALLPEGITVPSTIIWRDQANVIHHLTADQGRVLSAMMLLAQRAVWVRSWDLDAALADARNVADVEALDW